ncbi:MAG: hypothetical protein R6V85_14405 [Polyangia bacterium]
MSGSDGWTPEEIPDADHLYLRVHRNHARKGKPAPGAFRDHGGGMSTDWWKYSSPEETKARARIPEDKRVVSLHVERVRSVPMNVLHTPDRERENRAHTDVVGEKNAESRVKLRRAITDIPIPIPGQ